MLNDLPITPKQVAEVGFEHRLSSGSVLSATTLYLLLSHECLYECIFEIKS